MPWLQALLRVALSSKVWLLTLLMGQLAAWQMLAYQSGHLMVVQHLAR